MRNVIICADWGRGLRSVYDLFKSTVLGRDDNEKLRRCIPPSEGIKLISKHTDTESRASLMRNRISVNSIKHTCLNIFFSFCNLSNAAIILTAHHEKSEDFTVK